MRPDARHLSASPRALPEASVSRDGEVRVAPPSLSLPPAYHRARRLYRQGRHGEAIAALEAVLRNNGAASTPDGGAPADDRALVLRQCALLKAWCLIELKDHEAARRWLDGAIELARLTADDPSVAVLEMNFALFAGRYEEVRERASRLLATVTDPADLVHAELRLLLGAALRWQGRLSEAVSHVEFACAAFTVLDEPVRTAVAANFLGWTCLSLGRLDDARRWFEKSLEINTGLGAQLRMAQNYQNLAIVCYKQGDYELAVELLENEIKLVAGLADMTCRAKLALGQVRRLRSEHDLARPVLLQAYAEAREHRLEREEALSLEYLGDVCRDEGQPAEAREFYRRAMTIARRIAPRGDVVMELLRREGECLDLEGRHADANRVLNEARSLAVAVGDRFETAVIARCLGLNAAHLGRWDLAQRELRLAFDELKALTARHEAMVAAYHLARIVSRQSKTGSTPRARARSVAEAWRHALRAQQLSQELEVTHLADEIGGLVSGLARRRLEENPERPLWEVFSARRAPASRVVAVSAVMQQVLRRCDGFARYDTPVLLYGAAGTGKELLARRVHENSPRGARPFLRCSCAASQPEALERELFGASDTGGGGAPGLVAQAHGGTLLLTGVENLPRPLQGKVLRLIQEGAYRPQGDGRERRSDVRVMATTTSDLAALADEGAFRPDLYFRLRLMTVAAPALRDRREDALPLLDHFLTRLEGSSLPARNVFDAESLEMLVAYDWPGNAAEVEAIAQQAWHLRDLGRAVRLRRSDGGGGGRLELADEGPAAASSQTAHPSGLTWASLNSLIARSGGNKARTARNLGVSRVTLYRWLKQLDPDAL